MTVAEYKSEVKLKKCTTNLTFNWWTIGCLFLGFLRKLSELQWHCTVTCKCEASLDIYPAHIFAWLLVPLDTCHLIAVTAACDVLLKALCTKYGYEDSALRRSNGLNASSISMEGMGETWLQIQITYSKAHRSCSSLASCVCLYHQFQVDAWHFPFPIFLAVLLTLISLWPVLLDDYLSQFRQQCIAM